ncbi:MAG: 50S ribosomal protein L21 [Gammaproteobacteria bacterium]|nr:50S ribosomal protein L21 [Gammaproteobacteria bacterium]
MYAVIQTGGKQYRVAEGQVLQLEKLAVEAGEDVDFDKVLMVVDGEAQQVGAPYVNGAKVSAEVLEHGRGKKIHILKFKRRKHHMKRMGHRQHLTSVKIKKINKGK